MRELELTLHGCSGWEVVCSVFVVFLLTLGHPPLVLRCVGGQPMFVYILLGVYVWRLAGWLAGWLPELLL